MFPNTKRGCTTKISPGLESGAADENGTDSKKLTMAPSLQTPPSGSEKYASIRRSNLTRVNITPPTTPVDNNMPGKTTPRDCPIKIDKQGYY